MRITLILLVVSLLTGCNTISKPHVTASTQLIPPQTTASDPIDRLVAELSAWARTPREPWNSGGYSLLKSPATATPEQVVREYFSWDLRPGEEPDYKILKIQNVHIPNQFGTIGNDLYRAVLVSTPAGEKILLFQYEASRSFPKWWNRIYDAK